MAIMIAPSRHGIALLIVLALAAGAYAPGLAGPWLFDDRANIVDNAALRGDFGHAEDWRLAAISMPSGPLGRTVSGVTFALQSALPGATLTPLWSKAINLLLHLACGVLVLRLATALLSTVLPSPRARAVGLLAMATWLLAPLHVSTVLYAVQRMAQLSTLFVLLGLCLYVQRRRHWLTQRPTLDDLASTALWLILLTALAAFSKENGLLLPWLLAAVEVCWFCGRWAGATSRLFGALAVLALVGPGLLLVLWVSLEPAWLVAGYEVRDFNLTERVLTQLRLLWHYLYWLLVPFNGELGLFHDDIPWSAGPTRPPGTLMAALVWIALLPLAALWLWRGGSPAARLACFALVFWCAGHSLESGVFPLEMSFEHRNYLPSLGPVLALAALVEALVQRLQRARLSLLASLLPFLWVLILGVALLARTAVWSGDYRLAASLCERHPNSVRSCHFLVRLLIDESVALPLQRGERMLLARHHMLRLLNAHTDDLVNAAAFLTIDSYSVAAEAREEVAQLWLPRVFASLDGNRLDASEMRAVEQVLDCARRGVCVITARQQEQVIAALLGGASNRSRALNIVTAHRRASGLGAAAIRDEVRRLREQRPTDRSLWEWEAVLSRELGDWPAFYGALEQLVVLDRQRRLFPLLARALGAGRMGTP
jgi:hypothetical protein